MFNALVIADDLTGSAEIAGIGLRYGLQTRLLREPPAQVSMRGGLLVLDTDSRLLSADEAARKVAKFMRNIRPQDFPLIYKKIDSVLRGPVVAEVHSLMSVLKRTSALVLPQNPSRGRTVVEGIYQIDGMPLDATGFTQDPDHPARSARVLELLGSSPLLHQPVRYIGPKDQLPRTGITAVGASTPKEVAAWAAQVDETIVPAGGADLFRALLDRQGLTAGRRFETKLPGVGALFVCGSASAYAKELVKRAAAAKIPVCAMPVAVYAGEATSRDAMTEWEESILTALNSTSRAVVTVGRPVDRVRGASSRLLATLADVAARVLLRHRVSHLLVDGGATASAVCRKMNWNDFDISSELASGVVRMRVAGKNEQHVIVKPGSYPWPDQVWTAFN